MQTADRGSLQDGTEKGQETDGKYLGGRESLGLADAYSAEDEREREKTTMNTRFAP